MTSLIPRVGIRNRFLALPSDCWPFNNAMILDETFFFFKKSTKSLSWVKSVRIPPQLGSCSLLTLLVETIEKLGLKLPVRTVPELAFILGNITAARSKRLK